MEELFRFKVVVAGPFGVGKTAFIECISGVPTVGSEVSTSGEESRSKKTTTVGIEYGTFTLIDADLKIELVLIGTPGQDRFSAVREVAAIGADGIVLLVNATDPATWPTARSIYQSFRTSCDLPVVVVANRCSLAHLEPLDFRPALGLSDEVVVLHGDVVDPDDSRRFLIELLSQILDAETQNVGEMMQ